MIVFFQKFEAEMSDVKSARQGTQKMFDSLQDRAGPSGHVAGAGADAVAGMKRPSYLCSEKLAIGAAKRTKRSPKLCKPKDRQAKHHVEQDEDEANVAAVPKKCAPIRNVKMASPKKFQPKDDASKKVASPMKQTAARRILRRVVRQGNSCNGTRKCRESLSASAYRQEGYDGVNFKVHICYHYLRELIVNTI